MPKGITPKNVVRYDDLEVAEDEMKKFLESGVVIDNGYLMDVPSRRMVGELVETALFKYDGNSAEMLTTISDRLKAEPDVDVISVFSAFIHGVRKLAYGKLNVQIPKWRMEFDFIFDMSDIDTFRALAASASSKVCFFTPDPVMEGLANNNNFGVAVDGVNMLLIMNMVAML